MLVDLKASEKFILLLTVDRIYNVCFPHLTAVAKKFFNFLSFL